MQIVLERLVAFQRLVIFIYPDIQPTVNMPRHIPHALEVKLENELQRMVNLGIIAQVDEPTEWVSNVVAVEKTDKTLCICLDPRDLNKAIKSLHYKLPTTEEILAKLSKGKYYNIAY